MEKRRLCWLQATPWCWAFRALRNAWPDHFHHFARTFVKTALWKACLPAHPKIASCGRAASRGSEKNVARGEVSCSRWTWQCTQTVFLISLEMNAKNRGKNAELEAILASGENTLVMGIKVRYGTWLKRVNITSRNKLSHFSLFHFIKKAGGCIEPGSKPWNIDKSFLEENLFVPLEQK